MRHIDRSQVASSKPRGKTKTLQARVDHDTAERFAVVAQARGMTDSQLLREAIDNVLRAASAGADDLQEALRRQYEDARKALMDATARREPVYRPEANE